MRNDLSRADEVVRQGLRDGAYTAACLLAGVGEKVLVRRAYGRTGMDKDAPHTSEQTKFDVDSLTKPMLTAMLTMRAMEAGKLCIIHCLFSFLDVMTTRLSKFIFSRDLPVPSPTQLSASSATITGIPVSVEINLSRFANSAPPPVIIIP